MDLIEQIIWTIRIEQSITTTATNNEHKITSEVERTIERYCLLMNTPWRWFSLIYDIVLNYCLVPNTINFEMRMPIWARVNINLIWN